MICFHKRWLVDETVQKGLNFVFFLFLLLLLLMNFLDVADVVTFLASDRSSYITGASIEVTGTVYMSIETLIKSRLFFGVPANRESQEVTWLVPCRQLCGLRFTFVWLDNAVDISEVSQGLLWPITSQAHVWEDIVPLRTLLLINHRNVILKDDFLAKIDFNEWMKT